MKSVQLLLPGSMLRFLTVFVTVSDLEKQKEEPFLSFFLSFFNQWFCY